MQVPLTGDRSDIWLDRKRIAARHKEIKCGQGYSHWDSESIDNQIKGKEQQT
jgi:hypothetical protein